MTKYLTESDLKLEGCLDSEFEDTVHHDVEGIATDWVPSADRKCEDDSGSLLTFSFVPFLFYHSPAGEVVPCPGKPLIEALWKHPHAHTQKLIS